MLSSCEPQDHCKKVDIKPLAHDGALTELLCFDVKGQSYLSCQGAIAAGLQQPVRTWCAGYLC